MASRDRYAFLVTSWKSVIQKEKKIFKNDRPREEGKICADHKSNKGLLSQIYIQNRASVTKDHGLAGFNKPFLLLVLGSPRSGCGQIRYLGSAPHVACGSPVTSSRHLFVTRACRVTSALPLFKRA